MILFALGTEFNPTRKLNFNVGGTCTFVIIKKRQQGKANVIFLVSNK